MSDNTPLPGHSYGSIASHHCTAGKAAFNIDDCGADLWITDGVGNTSGELPDSILLLPEEALELLDFLKANEALIRSAAKDSCEGLRPAPEPPKPKSPAPVEYSEASVSMVQAHDHQHGGLRGHSIGNIYPLSVYAVIRNGETQWKVWNTLTGWTSQSISSSAEEAERYAELICSSKEKHSFAF